MARQRHWVNRGSGGDCVFFTTTVLDFIHAFEREPVRTAVAKAILRESRRSGLVLHAFVVMPHHIHFVARLPESLTPTELMRNFKPRISAVVRPMLTEEEKAQFLDQAGLNRNTFWQRSFRGKVIGSPRMFSTCLTYVHWNPVRAGYVETPAGYRWSSAKMWEDGLWVEEAGLPLDPKLLE